METDRLVHHHSNVWENAGPLSITATPNAGYNFSSWSSNTGMVTFDNPDSASATTTIGGTGTITATFAINTYPITVTQNANGQITPVTTTVNYGADQSFTITPNTGYYIASLTVDGSPVAVASSYSFSNVQASHTITATFALIPTSTPTPTSSASASTPTPTPTPAATSIPTTTPSPTPVSTQTPTVQHENQSATLPIELISVIAGAIAVVVISVAAFMVKKRNKSR